MSRPSTHGAGTEACSASRAIHSRCTSATGSMPRYAAYLLRGSGRGRVRGRVMGMGRGRGRGRSRGRGRVIAVARAPSVPRRARGPPG